MIEGNNIVLKALQKKESDKILEWKNYPELRKLTGTVYPINELEHEVWFEKKLMDSKNKIFSIYMKDNDVFIGMVGFTQTDFINRNAEIFIFLGDKQARGKGLGTDAISTLINFAFKELNLHRISLTVFEYNNPAINSYKKLGFEVEGVLRDALYKEGKYHNKIIMSILNK